MALEYKEIKPNTSNDTDKDQEKPKRKNIIKRVQGYLNKNYEIRINILTMELEYRILKQERFKTLDDRQLNTIWLDLHNKGIKCADTTLMKILNSNYTKTYHPIRDYFKSLPKPDDKDYIQELANTITIADIEIDNNKLADLRYD